MLTELSTALFTLAVDVLAKTFALYIIISVRSNDDVCSYACV